MDLYRVLEAPHITEKSTLLGQQGKYVFRVSIDANKLEIRKAVEKQFSVKVIDVNTIIMKPKERGVGKRRGITSAWKKAVVTLQSGQTIEEYFPTS